MSLYYNNFKYLDKNSMDQGLIVASFEPDDGFTDSFLSMKPIQEEYYDGTKVFDYGARYDTTAVINITVIKSNGSDFSLADVRSLSRWLTGSRINSWLDVGVTRIGPEPDDPNIKYSFLGRVTNLQPRKMDGRTTGFQIEFTSVAPWAFSVPQSFDCTIGQLMDVVDEGVVFISKENSEGNPTMFQIDSDGAVSSPKELGKPLKITDDGILYMDNAYENVIDNQSDDLYTYIYLDIDYQNENGTEIIIKNASINEPNGEETMIKNVSKGEKITISAKQFIISDIPNKLFGDDFNFVWPRLKPGLNEFIITGNGNGKAKFTYRYPMKVADCAMDISVYSGNGDCGEMAAYETVKWENIIGAPTSIKGYGIEDAYTIGEIDKKLQEVDKKIQEIDAEVEWDGIKNKPTTIDGYGITDVYTSSEVDNKIKDINVDWNNVSNAPTTIEGYGITNAYTTTEIDNKLKEINVDIEWNDISDKPTTIGGYGITDAYTISDVYTKTEIDDKIDGIEISGGGDNTGSANVDEEELNSMLKDILG